jgi:hypothetical protein
MHTKPITLFIESSKCNAHRWTPDVAKRDRSFNEDIVDAGRGIVKDQVV